MASSNINTFSSIPWSVLYFSAGVYLGAFKASIISSVKSWSEFVALFQALFKSSANILIESL